MKKHLVLVINSRSSGFALIKKKILPFIEDYHFNKNQLSTFEIQPTSPIENAKEMAKGLKDNDTILVAGGDGTAHIATNACVISGKKNLKIKYTGFGNFNDYAHSFSKNSGKEAIKAILKGEPKAIIKPIEIRINGEFYRYAPLYATIGLTAEMAEIFENPKIRKALKKTSDRNMRLFFSLVAATRFYFKHRKNHCLDIENIQLNNEGSIAFPKYTTDLVFMNGPRMARIMRSKKNKTDRDHFGFTALNANNFRKNIPFLINGVLGRMPLKDARDVFITFNKSSTIAMQIEGETCEINNVKNIEAKISNIEIKVL